MFDYVLALLTTLLPIRGNQVMEMDYRILVYGESPPAALFAYHANNPMKSRIQATNFAVLCATFDWDATRYVSEPKSPGELRLYTSYYLSVPTGINGLKFMRYHAQSWQTNWLASSLEEDLLKRLTIDSPTDASTLIDRLITKPENAEFVRWSNWHELMKQRRKSEALDYARRHELRTEISFSSQFPCLPFEVEQPPIYVLRPSPVRTELYQYFFPSQHWALRIVPPPRKPIFVPSSWKKPEINQYERAWKRGPSWQITYNQKDCVLTRTATRVEAESYIVGTISTNGFSESVVEVPLPPKGYVLKAPSYIEVE